MTMSSERAVTGVMDCSSPHATQHPPPLGFFCRSQAVAYRDSHGFGGCAPCAVVQVMDGSIGSLSSECCPFEFVEMSSYLGETGPLSQGVQEGRKALRILHIHGMEVRKKKPRRFKKKSRGFR